MQEGWAYATDAEGKLIVVPTDAPFSSLAERLWDPVLRMFDPGDDPEYNRAKVARLG